MTSTCVVQSLSSDSQLVFNLASTTIKLGNTKWNSSNKDTKSRIVITILSCIEHIIVRDLVCWYCPMKVDVKEHSEPTLPYVGLIVFQHSNLKHWSWIWSKHALNNRKIYKNKRRKNKGTWWKTLITQSLKNKRGTM